MALAAKSRVVVLEKEEHYWWCRQGDDEGWVVPDILTPLPKPPPQRRHTNGAAAAQPQATAQPQTTAQPQAAAQPSHTKPPTRPTQTPLVALPATCKAAQPTKLVADIFYSTLPPFTVVDADGAVQRPLPTAEGHRAPDELPPAQIRAPADIVGPAIVSHDQTWRDALFPNMYAVDKATVKEAEEAARTKTEAAKKREAEAALRRVRVSRRAPASVCVGGRALCGVNYASTPFRP